MRRLAAIPLILAAACGPRPTEVALADAKPAKLALEATLADGGFSQLSVKLDYGPLQGCPALTPAATASLDAAPLMTQGLGGSSSLPGGKSFCAQTATFESPSALTRPAGPAAATLTVTDGPTALKLALPNLFAPRAFTVDEAASSLRPGGAVVLRSPEVTDALRAFSVFFTQGATTSGADDVTSPTRGRVTIPIPAGLAPGPAALDLQLQVTPALVTCPVPACAASLVGSVHLDLTLGS